MDSAALRAGYADHNASTLGVTGQRSPGTASRGFADRTAVVTPPAEDDGRLVESAPGGGHRIMDDRYPVSSSGDARAEDDPCHAVQIAIDRRDNGGRG